MFINFKIIKTQILPIKSVGVQGDARSYRHPAVLFDYPKNWKELNKIATQITNRFAEVNRVLIALSPNEKQEFASIQTEISKERVKTLQLADKIVHDKVSDAGLIEKIWQFPVVLLPITNNGTDEAIVLRPVDSQEAMTASFSHIPFELLAEITEELLELPGISCVFFDITNKPPGTIEWE